MKAGRISASSGNPRTRVFGRSACEPFAGYDRAASTWLTHPPSRPSSGHTSAGRLAAEFCASWPRAGAVAGHHAYRLDGAGHVACRASARRWPTPNAAVSNLGERPLSWLKRRERLKRKRYNGNGAGMPLAVAARIGPGWLTASPESIGPSAEGLLNPAWVEWLMGFPLGWTECGAAGPRRGGAA